MNQADGWREFPDLEADDLEADDLEADDLEADDLEGTGYMCIACAMPVPGPGVSPCCGAPVVDTD